MDIRADDPLCFLVVCSVVRLYSGFGVLWVFGWGMPVVDVAFY